MAAAGAQKGNLAATPRLGALAQARPANVNSICTPDDDPQESSLLWEAWSTNEENKVEEIKREKTVESTIWDQGTRRFRACQCPVEKVGGAIKEVWNDAVVRGERWRRQIEE